MAWTSSAGVIPTRTSTSACSLRRFTPSAATRSETRMRYIDLSGRRVGGALVTEALEGVAQGDHGQLDVGLVDESQVADADDLACQLALTAGQHRLVLLVEQREQRRGVDALRHDDAGHGVRRVGPLAEEAQAKGLDL